MEENINSDNQNSEPSEGDLLSKFNELEDKDFLNDPDSGKALDAVYDKLVSQQEASQNDDSDRTSESSQEDSKIEQPSLDEDGAESSEQSNVDQAQTQEGDKSTDLEQLQQRLNEQENKFKELYAEFTRRSQKLRDYEKNDNSANSEQLTASEHEDQKKFAEMDKEFPDSKAYIEHKINKAVSEARKEWEKEFKPVQERLSQQDMRTFQMTLNKEADEFKNSAFKEFGEEAKSLLSGYLSHFNENREDFRKFVESGESLMQIIKNRLYEKYPERVAEAIVKHKKLQQARQNSSDSNEVDNANLGLSSSQGDHNPTGRKLEDYSAKELENMDMKELERKLRDAGAFKI